MISITNGKVGSMFFAFFIFSVLSCVFSRVDPVIGAYFGDLHLVIGCLHNLNQRTFFLLGLEKAWVFNHEIPSMGCDLFMYPLLNYTLILRAQAA